ncbi:hypothetical protein HK44_007860 [Pseudomonas fluorescens HK44]|uniref:Uncharacterized protein n=1 Tax=Pseudomonas fluorescens HK44 TaxID=1042209 RepID=A0A010SME7_PSEFL|nr:hypothetical protein HK44_007860 [Pseudomonas fluorescens HK44]
MTLAPVESYSLVEQWLSCRRNFLNSASQFLLEVAAQQWDILRQQEGFSFGRQHAGGGITRVQCGSVRA